MLHSKLMIIDDDFFILGSSNVDYRSFIHQYDINLLASNRSQPRTFQKACGETAKEF